MNCNEMDVRKTYQYLNHSQNGITELRTIRFLDNNKTAPGQCAYVNCEDDFVDFCKRNNGNGNVFTGINPIVSEKLNGTYSPSKKGDVNFVQSVILDIDPKRRPGIASTDLEMKIAVDVGTEIANDFEDDGYIRPAINLSGNGCQLWFAIPPVKITASNRDTFEKQVKKFEESIAEQYEKDEIQIDSMATYNHLIKVMGTLSVKGNPTDERPHRLSKFDMVTTRQEDAKLLEHILSFDISAPVKQTNIPNVDIKKLEAVTDTQFNLLILRATNKMCDGVKLLWSRGYSQDRSVAIFNMIMILAYEKFSLEEIILLVTYFDQKTDMKKLSGRDATLYITQAYQKVMDESKGEPLPPHHWLKDKGFCTDNIPCHVQKILGLNKIKDWKKSINDVVLDENDLKKSYEKVEPLLRFASQKSKDEQHKIIDGLKKKCPKFNKNTLKQMVRQVQKDVKKHFDDATAGYTGVFIENNCYKQVVMNAEGSKVVEISNFHMKIEKDIIFSSELAKDRILEGDFITKTGDKIPFRFTSPEFSNNHKLAQQILQQGGPQLQYNAKLDQLKLATQAVSKPETIRISDNFGWNDDFTEFRTPSVHINKDGIFTPKDKLVDMTVHDHAKHLDLIKLGQDDLKITTNHILTDLMSLSDSSVITPVMGHIFLAPIQELMGDDKYALWILGLTGVGKSFLAKLAQSFFGEFMRSGSVVSWNSTVNSIQTIGYLFKDSVYVVDDYKRNNKNEDDIIEKIQSYADKTGKSRLRQDASVQKTRFIRGLLFVTGEDTPTNEASTLARLLIVNYPKKETDSDKGFRCTRLAHKYSGVMSAYLLWFLKNNVKDELEEMFHKYLTKIHEQIKGKQNGIRIAQNLAQNHIGFTLFVRFLLDGGYIDTKKETKMLDTHHHNLLSLVTEMTEAVKEQQASKIFMQILNELIVSGKVFVDVNMDSMRNVSSVYHELKERMDDYYERQMNNRYVVGFIESEDAEITYIIPSVAWREVQKAIRESGDRFRFGRGAVLNQLMEDGYIVEYEERKGRNKSATTRKNYRGKQVRAWAISSKEVDIPDEIEIPL